jgi:hypothetical protein
MELASLTNLLIALIILLVAAGFYLAYYLKSLRGEITGASAQLFFEVTQRDDLLPLYIESLAKYFLRDSFDELIKLRAESMQMKGFGAVKKAREEQIWKLFDGLVKSAANNTEIKKDVILSALNKDFKEINLRVIAQSNFYNKLVGRYNSLVGNPLLKPVSTMVSGAHFEKF